MPKKSKLILIFIWIALISFFVNIKFKGHSICLFYNIFGLPCPSCGMTRSYLHLFHLDFKGAFHFHPLFWAVPFLLIFYKNRIYSSRFSLNHPMFFRRIFRVKKKPEEQILELLFYFFFLP